MHVLAAAVPDYYGNAHPDQEEGGTRTGSDRESIEARARSHYQHKKTYQAFVREFVGDQWPFNGTADVACVFFMRAGGIAGAAGLVSMPSLIGSVVGADSAGFVSPV